MDAERHPVTRAMFERNLDGKLRDPGFASDMSGLLAAGREWHVRAAARSVTNKLLARLPGEEWRGRKLGASGPDLTGEGCPGHHSGSRTHSIGAPSDCAGGSSPRSAAIVAARSTCRTAPTCQSVSTPRPIAKNAACMSGVSGG